MSNLVVDTLTNQDTQLCKAWVNFNGTGTVAIRSSYNVSSITDNALANYTINFTTAMTDANYVVTGTCHSPAVASGAVQAPATSSANQQVGSVKVVTVNMADVGFDAVFVQVAVFR